MRWPVLVLLPLLGGCPPTEPLPSVKAVSEAVNREELPPLYRKLYDYAFLPEVQASEQRVRLRIWLRHMEFDRYQLGQLEELIGFSQREFAAVEARHAEIVGGYEPAVGAVYDELWAAMERGADDAELARLADTLDVTKRREAELLELRAGSVRTVLDAQKPFLATFTPKQDALFADAVWALRHRLDPWANPGDFRALVGTVYREGEFGTLTRPTFDPAEDHLNIGGLWSESPETLSGPYFQDARRDVVLYLLLLEPTLPEALAAVKAERQRAGATSAPAGAEGGAPQPPAPSPGVPEAPSPGVPAAPEPVAPSAPPPG